MNAPFALSPVGSAVVVDRPVDEAFDLFTTGMRRWWPVARSIGKSPLVDMVLEPHAGGRWYEVDANGAQLVWGKVIDVIAPTDNRLGRLILGWQLTPDSVFDANATTVVTLTFKAEGDTKCRLELEHSGLEIFGADSSRMRANLAGSTGWPAILGAFTAVAANA